MRYPLRSSARAALASLAALALTAGVGPAAAHADAGRQANQVARRIFALASGPSSTTRAVRPQAASAAAHLPNLKFAGYVTHHNTGATTIVAHFTIPDLKCTKEERATGPGAFLLTGPGDREVFNAANIIEGCLNGVKVGFPVLVVDGSESNFDRPIRPGDSIVVRLTNRPGGKTVVQLSNLSPHHRYTLTKSGRGNAPDAQLVGDWATASKKLKSEVLPPDIRPTTFRSVSIDGRPLGSRAPIAYDLTDINRVVLIATGAITGALHNVFTCTRTAN